jgi:glycine C-acetyltransferase|eukprot:TRINITY_DN3024_c0_g1_i1.p1 TRINITY_DN3024_c0_g1~~TRINITY_DN3024_c0_g1_i1.p1  ORF type:complete len:433 (+),score=60.86 TRINITY_DN3024_c0_g1_i1:48-1346(+)
MFPVARLSSNVAQSRVAVPMAIGRLFSSSRLDTALTKDLSALASEGRAKAPERVIVDYIPAKGSFGPRYRLDGYDQEFIRMNSNNYLSLSHRPEVIAAADAATHRFGTGPGAVRFIDGTHKEHVELEKRIAAFVNRPAAKIFNSAYTSNLGLAIAIQNKKTYWIGDELNHNCIIRGMRIANVPSSQRTIFKHNDMEELKRAIENVPDGIERVVVIFDGVFSMRGDHAPLVEINAILEPHRNRFKDGVTTIVDDSHGIGAFGATGRGTEEINGIQADIMVGTFGKAFGVNGGFIAGSEAVIECVRQKADTYIYTNPLSSADCAAAHAAVDITDSEEGRARLKHVQERIAQLRAGIAACGHESIPGQHPVVPIMVRDTEKTQNMVKHFLDHGVLVVGLNFPVVPEGNQALRFQINAAHTEADIDYVLQVLKMFG